MGPTHLHFPLLVGITAFTLTRRSVIRPKTLVCWTRHQEMGSSPASGPRPRHRGSSLPSGSLSLAICRKLCRSPEVRMGPNSQRPAVAPFPRFGQSLSKLAVTAHWPVDLFTPHKGLPACSFCMSLFPSTWCPADRGMPRPTRMTRQLCPDCRGTDPSESLSSGTQRGKRDRGTKYRDRDGDSGALSGHTHTGSFLGIYLMAGQPNSPPN